MKVGFTGTQVGMVKKQAEEFLRLIQSIEKFDEFHHGDCIGADEDAHSLVFNGAYCINVVKHPPKNNTKRAYCAGGVFRKAYEYLERNHHIVDETDILIATPKAFVEETRSGTWATIRYAKKQGKKVYIIYPNGEVEIHNG